MILTDEELDKKIKFHDTCIDCKYSYVEELDIIDLRHCMRFQYDNEDHDDVIVEDDNYCDEFKEKL